MPCFAARLEGGNLRILKTIIPTTVGQLRCLCQILSNVEALMMVLPRTISLSLYPLNSNLPQFIFYLYMLTFGKMPHSELNIHKKLFN